MKKNESEYGNFISYFQKVTTIGVITCGKDYDDAESEARLVFKNISKEPDRMTFEETEWELSDTVEYDPEVSCQIHPSFDKKSVEMNICFSEDMKCKIAKILNKDIDCITEQDVYSFAEKAIYMAVSEKDNNEK